MDSFSFCQDIGTGRSARACLATAWMVLLLLVAGCSSDQRLAQGDLPPPFSLPTLEGDVARFPEDYTGQVVAIRFWADWCPYCKGEMQELEPVFAGYRDRGLVILAVNVNQDRETAARFVDSLGIHYPVLLDLRGQTARSYQVIGLPTTYIIDRQGRIHTKISGESSAELFIRIIEEIL